MLEAQLRHRGLIFGDRALCTVLRPRFVTPAQYSRMQHRVETLMRAFAAAYEAAMADPAVRAQFRLADWEERMLAYDPGFTEPSPHSRLDTFVVDETGEMALTEYNAETPAGSSQYACGREIQPAESSGIVPPVRDAWLRERQVRPAPAT